jgi:pimeloyl-ACP methyl ester carboxylesterase
VHLVGHSLGGLVVRDYARSPWRDARVVQTISLAAPFLGSKRSWLVPGHAGRELVPGSSLLEQLRTNSRENEQIPHLTLVAEEDEMIVPGAYPDFGSHEMVRSVGHNAILFDSGAIARVVRQIESFTQNSLGDDSGDSSAEGV